MTLYVTSFWAQGQTTTQDLLPPAFIPKSPTVATFQRFDAQQFVNLPTGGAQLSIPLAEINCGSLHLPITLSYSYSGLQVGQPYELVGLGWTLQPSISITRQVNGLLDDPLAQDIAHRYNPDTVLKAINNPTYRYLKLANEEEVDVGPDVYSFSLPSGSSGRFIIRDTTIIMLPQQPVHIQRLGVASAWGFQGFQVTTEDGLRYQFQAAEVTTPNPNNFGSIGTHFSAWHLTRMISANNSDTLRLHYSAFSAQIPDQCSVTTGRYYTGSYHLYGHIALEPADVGCGSRANYFFHNVSLFATRLTAQYLDSITTRGSHLVLSRSGSNHELRQLQLFATTGEHRLIRQVSLYQSAFDKPLHTNEYHLRLDSLQESVGQTVLPAYHFTYLSNEVLPERASAAKDYWGYWNGAHRNGDYATTDRPTLLNDPQMRVAGLVPANREPVFDFAKMGALVQVRYPTGGTTRWEYEANRMAFRETQDTQQIPVDTLRVQVGPISYDAAKSIPLYGGPRTVTASQKVAFYVPQDANVLLTLSRRPYDRVHFYGYSNTYRDFNIWKQSPTGQDLITNGPDGNSEYKSLDPDSVARFTYHLTAGTYIAQIYCEQLEQYTGLSINIPFQDSSQVKLGLPGPGIRVWRTTTTATAAVPPLVRTYRYTLAGKTSGKSLLANYGKVFDSYNLILNTLAIGHTLAAGLICEYKNVSSDAYELGSEFKKYTFFYEHVTEELGNGQGATASSFICLPELFNDVVPSSVVVYRQDASQPTVRLPVQKTEYFYKSDSATTYPLIQIRKIVQYAGNVFGPDADYAARAYEVRAGFSPLVQVQQVLYDAQGQAHSTLTHNTYKQQRVVRTSTKTSTGYNIRNFKYLSDYSVPPAVSITRNHFFNPVVETQHWQRLLTGNDSLLVAGQLTLYHPTWRSPVSSYRLRLDSPQPGPNQEVIRNGRYTSFFSDTRYEAEAAVQYAAGSGDLVQHQSTHGLPTCFLTGYARTLIIAEATNAPYSQVASTSFEPEATGRWRYDSTGTHRVLGGRTGRWAYQLDGLAHVSREQLPVGDYELTYWLQGANAPTLTIQGGVQRSSGLQLLATAPNNWRQFGTRLHLTATGQISLDIAPNSPSSRLDELRLYPVGAQLTSFTHEPLVGMTSQTDPAGRTIFYEYDGLGRLVRTRDEQGRILSQQQYHYGN